MMNYLSNKEGALRALTFFIERHEEKPIFSSKSEIKPMPSEVYVNKEITVGGGTIDLLKGSANNEVGVTNFDGNKLDDGRAFAVDGVAFHIAIGDSGAHPYNVDYDKGVQSSEFQPFQFANLVLKQNNEILVKLPISSIENGKENFSEYRDLDLTLISPKTKVEVQIQFPDDVAVPVLDDGKALFVSAKFRGYESYQRR
ncbi:hypothetical protein V3A08_07450 [Tenacibaculum maritimum]|uniref:hypothetical protein n=1 Tax=Tenacibaculum maritimum TaxID=107401 RepID=UPI00387709B5